MVTMEGKAIAFPSIVTIHTFCLFIFVYIIHFACLYLWDSDVGVVGAVIHLVKRNMAYYDTFLNEEYT